MIDTLLKNILDRPKVFIFFFLTTQKGCTCKNSRKVFFSSRNTKTKEIGIQKNIRKYKKSIIKDVNKCM
jgi:hypothetical protein